MRSRSLLLLLLAYFSLLQNFGVFGVGEEVLTDEQVQIAIVGNYSIPEDIDLVDLTVLRRSFIDHKVNDSNLMKAEREYYDRVTSKRPRPIYDPENRPKVEYKISHHDAQEFAHGSTGHVVIEEQSKTLTYRVTGNQIEQFYAAMRDKCSREGFHASVHDCSKACNPPCGSSHIKCPLTYCQSNDGERFCKWRCGANTILRNVVSAICVLLGFIAIICFCRAWGDFKNRYNALVIDT